MRCQIESQLVDFVQTVSTDTSIHSQTDLVAHNLLDSLLLMDLVILIENEMGIRFSGDDIAPENFRCLERLATIVKEKKSNMRQVA